MEVIYSKCCCFNYGINWFYILRQDDYTSRNFENKDTALKQSTSENSSLSKVEDVQVKDGDNSKNKGPVYVDVKVLLNILMFIK